jgi:hypothetical protein
MSNTEAVPSSYTLVPYPIPRSDDLGYMQRSGTFCHNYVGTYNGCILINTKMSYWTRLFLPLKIHTCNYHG